MAGLINRIDANYIRMKVAEFVPKSIVCFREGYSWSHFLHDLFAGASVGVIALPLALAFAIASGVPPEKGLFTAIVAGFLISLLGGSRVQIGGPTGAFVVIVYAVIQKHGYEGLALATLIAAAMMILMGIARLGVLLKFIPYPVTTGFTTGIAVVIFSSQIKEFFGLQIDNVPPQFLEKCKLFCVNAHTWNPWAFLIALSTLVIIFFFRRFFPKLPGVLLAVSLTTLVAQMFDLPMASIEARFGEIPRLLPTPAWPDFSWDLFKRVFPDAVTIALLGAIESLLSALVADGMSGNRHRSNCELVAQGIANTGSILFGGIPATGAIARTAANIRLGAKTPVAGMLHAVTLLLLMLFLAPLAGKIPLAALSGVLFFIAWNMAELPHFIEILRGQKGDAAVLLITFLLTVLIDLAVAVQIGVILSAVLFIKRMSSKTTLEACKMVVEEEAQLGKEADHTQASGIEPLIFEINGPFFYAVADLLDEALILMDPPKTFILRLHKTPLIDATGMQALKKFHDKCIRKGILFLISDLNAEQRKLFQQAGLDNLIGKEHLFDTVAPAVAYARRTKGDLAMMASQSRV